MVAIGVTGCFRLRNSFTPFFNSRNHFRYIYWLNATVKNYSSSSSVKESELADSVSKEKLSGFAQAFEKFSKPKEVESKPKKSFTQLLRESKFIDVSMT